MADKTHINRARGLASEIAKQDDFVREIIAKAYEVLKLPLADTFLGRKTQEPFPKEDE